MIQVEDNYCCFYQGCGLDEYCYQGVWYDINGVGGDFFFFYVGVDEFKLIVGDVVEVVDLEVEFFSELDIDEMLECLIIYGLGDLDVILMKYYVVIESIY